MASGGKAKEIGDERRQRISVRSYNGVDTSISCHEDTSWPELQELFFQFLLGCGYNLTREEFFGE
jgi:hypothetical protein